MEEEEEEEDEEVSRFSIPKFLNLNEVTVLLSDPSVPPAYFEGDLSHTHTGAYPHIHIHTYTHAH